MKRIIVVSILGVNFKFKVKKGKKIIKSLPKRVQRGFFDRKLRFVAGKVEREIDPRETLASTLGGRRFRIELA